MKIGIVGATGRMGQLLVETVLSHKGVELSGATSRAVSPYMGQDIGEICGIGTIGQALQDDTEQLILQSDALIDFTNPEASMHHAALCAEKNVIHIIGTTGLSAAQEDELSHLAQKTQIIYAPNMSTGVNLLLGLVRQVADILDPTYNIEIIEAHHNKKLDAPSGTALALGHAAAAGRQTDLEEAGCFTRHGQTSARTEAEIGFSVIRGGDIAGEHTVMFAAEGERIELTHKASDRAVFARGAVKAAIWAKDQPTGLYSMQDVLGLT